MAPYLNYAQAHDYPFAAPYLSTLDWIILLVLHPLLNEFANHLHNLPTLELGILQEVERISVVPRSATLQEHRLHTAQIHRRKSRTLRPGDNSMRPTAIRDGVPDHSPLVP